MTPLAASLPQLSRKPAFKRILLKLSGEALMGPSDYGLDAQTVDSLARELVEVRDAGLEVALVIGGGNIYRGMAAAAEGMDRATGDYMGMLATVLNSLAVQEALERHGANTRGRPSSRSWRQTSAASPTCAASPTPCSSSTCARSSSRCARRSGSVCR